MMEQQQHLSSSSPHPSSTFHSSTITTTSRQSNNNNYDSNDTNNMSNLTTNSVVDFTGPATLANVPVVPQAPVPEAPKVPLVGKRAPPLSCPISYNTMFGQQGSTTDSQVDEDVECERILPVQQQIANREFYAHRERERNKKFTRTFVNQCGKQAPAAVGAMERGSLDSPTPTSRMAESRNWLNNKQLQQRQQQNFSSPQPASSSSEFYENSGLLLY